MAPRAKRRAFLPGEEKTLYDQDDELEAAALEDEEGEHENGAAPVATPLPPSVDYLETADESELRTIISNIQDTVECLLAVPEWKTKDGKVVRVLIRSLTTLERTQFIKMLNSNGSDLTKVYPDLVILSTRHPTTKRLVFEAKDRRMLLTKMGKACERIALRAADISGLSQEAYEDMKKN